MTHSLGVHVFLLGALLFAGSIWCLSGGVPRAAGTDLSPPRLQEGGCRYR